jgi:phosphoglycerol transferase
MTLGTLGAARLISRATRKVRAMWLVPLAAMVIVGGISEQLFPRWTVQQHDGIRARAESDRGLVEQLQARIPKGSKVFQLPVVGFPEESYEPFRPFLFSDGLKFSYAAMRGRPEANWQRQTAALAPHEMLAALRQEGFRAIYVLGDGNALFQAIRAEAPQAEFLVSADRSSSVIVIPTN